MTTNLSTISGAIGFMIFHPLQAAKYIRDAYCQQEGIVTCELCGKPITEDQENVGYECNLHEWCVVEDKP